MEIHFKQSSNLDQQSSGSNLKPESVANYKKISPNSLRDAYPEAVQFLSLLLKQIVNNNNMRREIEEEERNMEFKDEINDKSRELQNSDLVEINYSSEEYDLLKRPEKKESGGKVDDAERETATVKDIVKAIENVIPTERDSSDKTESDESNINYEGLSLELITKPSSLTRPNTLTSQPTPFYLKLTKNKDIKRKKHKDLQLFHKDVSSKQDNSNETEPNLHMQAKGEIEDEEQKMIEEMKNIKKVTSEPTSLLAEDDKNASNKEIIEEKSNTKQKTKAPQNQKLKANPIEPFMHYEEKNWEELLEGDDDGAEVQNYKTTTLKSTDTPKPNEKGKKNTVKSKQSHETEKESEIKEEVKKTVFKQTSYEQIDDTHRFTKLGFDAYLGKSFRNIQKVITKFRKPKITTKLRKIARKRSFQNKRSKKPKRGEIESEDTSKEITDSQSSDKSISSKERFYPHRQRLRNSKAKKYVVPIDSDDDSPMYLPPILADFQMATKDRLVTTLDPLTTELSAKLWYEGASNNNEDIRRTRSVKTIDDLNLQLGIPEEWVFRRRIPAANTSLEAYLKAMKKT